MSPACRPVPAHRARSAALIAAAFLDNIAVSAGRSPHDALDALAFGILKRRVNWVLDADFREFFTSLDHQWLVRFLEHRIADRRVLRLIRKWLAAGVIEDGAWTASEAGVPQGAAVSPLLGNVYLHYVFDQWAHQWRTRHAHGDVVIVRFADDLVVGFEHREDAERFWADLRDRLAKFALELNADKTRLIEFGGPPPRTASGEESASLRRSSFSASRIFARRPRRGVSSSSGSPTRNGCAPSSER